MAKKKAKAQPKEQQFLLFDGATMAGLEPHISEEDANYTKKSTAKKSKDGIQKWEKPFLREDGLIWVDVGHGEWEAFPANSWRVGVEFQWYQHPVRYKNAIGRLNTWLDLKRVREEQQRERETQQHETQHPLLQGGSGSQESRDIERLLQESVA